MKVRLLFADEGAFHHQEVTIPRSVLDRYERIIDCLREDRSVLQRIHVDLDRLCSAVVAEDDAED